MNQKPEKIARLRNLSKQARRYRRGLYGQNCPENLKAVRDEVFLVGGLEMLERSDVIVMIPGWEQSAGSRDELNYAKLAGKEIIYEQ